MAIIPSFEATLLEINQSLDLPSYPTRIKDDFSDLGLSIENHQKKIEELLDSIFRAMDMDVQAQSDASKNIYEWIGFHKALELNTWTFNASQEQVLWHLLSHSYVPAIARRLAFWNIQDPLDSDMPKESIWFLPNIDSKTGILKLPVPKVIEWLFDLIDSPVNNMKGLGGSKKALNGGVDSIERTLYNWLSGTLPDVASIKEYFPDEAQIEFKGALKMEADLSVEAKFEKALAFVEKRNLDVNSLSSQILMAPYGRLEAVLDRKASEKDKDEFIQLLLARYSAPTMHTVRQRLIVARMMQDAYKRLLKYLFPIVAETCTNFEENKLLQLLRIFNQIYSLTIQAHKNHINDVKQQDIWFESQLTSNEKKSIFLAVLPSKTFTGYSELSRLFTRRFSKLSVNSPLENFMGWDEQSHFELDLIRSSQIKEDAEDKLRYEKIRSRVLVSSAWRALQTESKFEVVVDIVQDESLRQDVRIKAINRLNELADTPTLKIQAITLELAILVNNSDRKSLAVRDRVDELLALADANTAYDDQKAPLLQYRAKHLLFKNDFENAGTYFRLALNACSDKGYGTLRGNLARDAFALAVANQGLIIGNHEKYYRNMVAYGMMGEQISGLEDAALWVSDYFWDDLYKPYIGLENIKPLANKQTKIIINETFGLIFKGDWNGLNIWFKRNAKIFHKKKIREVRGNTILMSWLKMLHYFESTSSSLKSNISVDLKDELTKFKKHLENWHEAIVLLIEAWPEQASLVDFKGQTPLMLAADAGDEVTVKTLLEGNIDINVQDYLGRTALHAATTVHSITCVEAILAHKPDVRKVTVQQKHTVLHVATRIGNPKIVRMLLDYAPELESMENVNGDTSLTLVLNILDDLPKHVSLMRLDNRQIGSRKDFEDVLSTLSSKPVTN